MSKYKVKTDPVTVQEVVAAERIAMRSPGWVMEAVQLIVNRVTDPQLTHADVMRLVWPEFEWLKDFVMKVVADTYEQEVKNKQLKEFLEQWEPTKENHN